MDSFGFRPSSGLGSVASGRGTGILPETGTMRYAIVGVIVAGLISVTGCGRFVLFDGCEGSGSYGLTVQILEKGTGEQVFGAVAWARDGAYIDTLTTDGHYANGATDRPGT